MQKRAALTAGDTSTATAELKGLASQSALIIKLQEDVRAGSAFFF
jgi:hypothetical protein